MFYRKKKKKTGGRNFWPTLYNYADITRRIIILVIKRWI